jgi:hypothetical protein
MCGGAAAEAPNKGMEPIAYSLRFATTSGNGSCLAFGTTGALVEWRAGTVITPASYSVFSADYNREKGRI